MNIEPIQTQLHRFTWFNLPASVALVGAIVLIASCSSTPHTLSTTDGSILRVREHFGGVQERTLTFHRQWLQTFANKLLVLEIPIGRLLHELELGQLGDSGSAVDIITIGNKIFVVLEDDAVVEISLPERGSPRIVRRWTSDNLKIFPRQLSQVNGQVFASGLGGITCLNTMDQIYDCPSEVASRVVQGDEGLITTRGRRAYRISDDSYVGSATDLQPLPPTLFSDVMMGPSIPHGSLIFVRQSGESASVGIMNPSIREISVHQLTVEVPGVVHRVRAFDGRIWIITDETIRAYTLTGGRLGLRARIDLRGVRDVDRLARNYLAFSGPFGRAIYRLHEDESGLGERLLYLHREPCEIDEVFYDGRQLILGGEFGYWQYRMGGDDVTPTSRPSEQPISPQTSFSGLDFTAEIQPDQRSLTITRGDQIATYDHSSSQRLHCLAKVGEDIWLGHADGITVVRPSDPDEPTMHLTTVASIKLPGSAGYLLPLFRDAGAVYVTPDAGFGVVIFSSD